MPDGSWDCNAACLDPVKGPRLLWGNKTTASFTLMNCLLLPWIASSLARGTLWDTYNLTGKYNILSNDTAGFSSTWMGYPVVAGCLEAYCTLNETNCPDDIFRIDTSCYGYCTQVRASNPTCCFSDKRERETDLLSNSSAIESWEVAALLPASVTT